MAIERRTHTRVSVPVNVRVVDAPGGKEEELGIRDISLQGIFLYTRTPGEVGKRVTLKLALTAGIKPLTVHAKVVRIENDGADPQGSGMGLRFLSLTTEAEKQILDLVDRAMIGRGTKMRAFPRIYKLLDVKCRTSTEFKALLRDIGEGGTGLVVAHPLPLNLETVVEISRAGFPSLVLPGWVVSSEALEERPGMFRIGVRFSRLSAAVRKDLQEYLHQLYRR